MTMQRHAIACALLLLVSLAARAEDLLGPADYLKIVVDSKLRYRFESTPAKTPAEVLTCPRRDESMRVVVKEGGKSLVPWKVRPEAAALIEEGEKSFRNKDADSALAKYKAAIAVDPEAVAAHLYAGDAMLFGKQDPAAALEHYRRAIALDPTLPSAHFFASTAYTHLANHTEARNEVVEALTYYPGYEAVLKIAAERPDLWRIQPLRRHPFEPPAGHLGKKEKDSVPVYAGSDGRWLGYTLCKAAWANEPQFAKRRSADGGWSLEEERACVVNQMMGAFNAADEDVAKMPELERHLYEVAREKLLDGYILFEIIGRHCPLGLSMMADGAKEQLRNYIRKYVIVPSAP